MMRKDFLRRNAKLAIAALVSACWLSASAFAQAGEEQSREEHDLAPPPVIAMTNQERAQLSAESDFKRRVQLCLQLADARLQRAEQSTAAENYQEALAELGGYRAIVDNGLKYLRGANNDIRRLRDHFRRLEMALRTHTPRLETMRRSTPYEYAHHLKTFMVFARGARALALDSFFSDTVVPGGGSPDIEDNQKTLPASGVNVNATFATEKKP